MSVMTMPKKKGETKEDLVLALLPRRAFEKIVSARIVREYAPTTNDRRAILRARERMHKNRATGKLLTLDELKRKLARTR